MLLNNYLTETQNIKALYSGLQIILALVKPKARQFKKYSKTSNLYHPDNIDAKVNKNMYDKAIG